MTKEEFHDEKIAPLMTQIIALCKERKIAMIASFKLDGDMACTSALLQDSFEPSQPQLDALDILKPRNPVAFAETTETLPDGSKRISIRRIS